ncbi:MULTISPECIES: galactosyldiacylglycerol synthase [Shewanella]|jgi:hypothetical protein|uniref:Galactosyldiacylglycerol synthase n=1 Tax=Shewanella chilikensis TaxID=558541 RepID=A0A6G7LND8_9GAMM|nr:MULTISPECIES: galactosyldiacylglycerol synthase [Shewanella]MBZ4680196.1 hypothetical protein [Shewanella sp.]MCA0948772.1 hypothetical protein [Shewanella chilikensis]MCE9853418.1 hypothetical protein [Shewanella chilikensis]MCL1153730.1 hypothetical protein [Shewanella chilikensis]MCL1163578.1 hypothetical protein [Shewanella chilikensis]
MIQLSNKETGAVIGHISEQQLQFLIDNLVEEHDADQDYWLNRTQLETFKAIEADAELINLLEAAMGEADELEILWQRQG